MNRLHVLILFGIFSIWNSSSLFSQSVTYQSSSWVDSLNLAFENHIENELTQNEFDSLILIESSYLNEYFKWRSYYVPRFQKSGVSVKDYNSKLENLFANPLPKYASSGSWFELGPNEPIDETITGSNANGELGIGPIDFITMDPNFNPNANEKLVLCGGWSSGLFYSVDGGYNWQNAGTDQLAGRISGANAAISHNNNNHWLFIDGYGDEYPIIPIANADFSFSGSGKIQDPHGIYLTKNRGQGWERVLNVDDFGTSPSDRKCMKEIVFDPSSSNSELTAYCSSNMGLWRSKNVLTPDPTPDGENEGVIWENVLPLNECELLDTNPDDLFMVYFYDIEWIPDPNHPCQNCNKMIVSATKWFPGNVLEPVIYVSETTVDYQVGDPGSWYELSLHPDLLASYERIGLEITQDNPDIVYAFANEGESDVTLNRLFKYSWTNGWTILDDTQGSGKGILTANDLIKASPIDEDFVCVQNWTFSGGPGISFSNDGGASISNIGSQSAPTTYHDDTEDLEFYPDGSKILVACHGGIYITDSNFSFWDKGLNGLGVGECEGFASSLNMDNKIALGLYHCGQKISSGNFDLMNWDPLWSQVGGSDGTTARINYNNGDTTYTSSQGSTRRFDDSFPNLGSSNSIDTPGLNPWIRPFELNYFKPNVIYMPNANQELYRHKDFGGNAVDPDWEVILDGNLNHPSIPGSEFKITNTFNSTANSNLHFAAVSITQNQILGQSWSQILVTNNVHENANVLTNEWISVDLPSDFGNSNVIYPAEMTDIESVPLNPNQFFVCTGVKHWSDNYPYKLLKFNYLGNDIINDDFDPSSINNFDYTDYTFNFPDVHINQIHVNPGTPEYLISTDLGVYYTNEYIIADQSGVDPEDAVVWYEYGDNLPNCNSTGLEPNYGANVLRSGTFGRGVWEINLPCEKLEEDYQIEAGQHLNLKNPTRWRQDIWIRDGGQLTINSEAYFAPHCGIKIERGGKLIIEENALLTSACDELWRGIEVWGLDFYPQTFEEQGYVRATGGRIENAQCGIWVRQNTNECEEIAGTGGGIVRCHHTEFVNCPYGVNFSPYVFYDNDGNETKNASYFKNCTFLTDDIILGGFDPKAGIQLDNVYGIDILGCDFLNTAINNSELDFFYNDVSKRGVGVRSYGSNFKLAKLCSGYNGETCINYDYGSCIDLFEAVQAFGSDDLYPFEVSETTFEGNVIGVRMEGTYGRVVLNTFSLRDQDENVSPQLVNAGIDIEGVDNFEITENTFSSHPSADINGVYIGIACTNNYEQDKVIRKNYFDGLTQGFHIQGNNGTTDPFDFESGLMISCNDFGQNGSLNKYDIRLRGPFDTNGVIEETTINPEQGSLNGLGTPAGNRFSHSCVEEDADFRVSLANNNSITYFHTSDLQSSFIDDCYTDEKITGIGLIQGYGPGTCPQEVFPQTLDIFTPPDDLWNDEIQSGLDDLEIVKSAFLDELDRGDINGLVSFINDPSKSSSEVRNEMLSCIPYISLTSWKSAFTKQPSMDPWHLAQVLLAASPLKQKVIDMMYTYNMEDFYRTLVLEGQNGGVTSKGIYQNEIANLSLNVNKATGEYYRTLLSPNFGDKSNSVELKNKLIDNPNFDSQLLASMYIRKGESIDALNVLGTCDTNDNDFTCEVLTILANSNSSQSGQPKFSNSQKLDLELIANSGIKGYVFARCALAAEYPEYEEYWPANISLDWENRSSEIQSDESSTKNPFIEIHPNPASNKGYVVLRIPEGSKGQVKITDSFGKSVYVRSISYGHQILEITPSYWGSGIYVCTLVIDDTIVATQKWVIEK